MRVWFCKLCICFYLRVKTCFFKCHTREYVFGFCPPSICSNLFLSHSALRSSCSSGINPNHCSFLICHFPHSTHWILMLILKFILWTHQPREYFCKQQSRHSSEISLPSVSVLCLCRGRGISQGWRLPALQNLWEVEGKIKPSSRCQGESRWRRMETIFDIMIVSHFNSHFWLQSQSHFSLLGVGSPPWIFASETVLCWYTFYC